MDTPNSPLTRSFQTTAEALTTRDTNKTTIGSKRRVISKRTIKRQVLLTIFRKRSFNMSHKHRIKTNHIITVTDYNGFKRKCQILNPPRCTLRRFLRLGLDVRRKSRRDPLLLILRLSIIYLSKNRKNEKNLC